MVRGAWTFVWVALICAQAFPAIAENSACWGDNSRDDITCVQITEPLLLSLRGQAREQVRRLLNAPGRPLRDNGLAFLSLWPQPTGSGRVYVRFDDGKAKSVFAYVDDLAHRFLWSAYAAPLLGAEIDLTNKDFNRSPVCSDLTGKPTICKGGGIDRELTITQMESGMKPAELREVLELTCRLADTDPSGDCQRLRLLLQ